MLSYKYLEKSFWNVNDTNAMTPQGDQFSPLKPPAVDLVLTIQLLIHYYSCLLPWQEGITSQIQVIGSVK